MVFETIYEINKRNCRLVAEMKENFIKIFEFDRQTA